MVCGEGGSQGKTGSQGDHESDAKKSPRIGERGVLSGEDGERKGSTGGRLCGHFF